MWVVNDEDPEKIDQGFETCVTLRKSCKGKGKGWFVWDVMMASGLRISGYKIWWMNTMKRRT